MAYSLVGSTALTVAMKATVANLHSECLLVEVSPEHEWGVSGESNSMVIIDRELLSPTFSFSHKKSPDYDTVSKIKRLLNRYRYVLSASRQGIDTGIIHFINRWKGWTSKILSSSINGQVYRVIFQIVSKKLYFFWSEHTHILFDIIKCKSNIFN